MTRHANGGDTGEGDGTAGSSFSKRSSRRGRGSSDEEAAAAAAIIGLLGAGDTGAQEGRRSLRSGRKLGRDAGSGSRAALDHAAESGAEHAQATPPKSTRPHRAASPKRGRWASGRGGGAVSGAGGSSAGEEGGGEVEGSAKVGPKEGEGEPSSSRGPRSSSKTRTGGSSGRPPRHPSKKGGRAPAPRVAKKGPSKRKAEMKQTLLDIDGNEIVRKAKFPRELADIEKVLLQVIGDLPQGVEAYGATGVSEASYLWWDCNVLEDTAKTLADDENYQDDPQVLFGSIENFSPIYDWVGSQKTQLRTYV
ncbi:unnamed protein product, partial [Ectocarpus sp. 6 AP-2014]